MPRVKTPPKKCLKTHSNSTPSNWVFLLKGEAFEVPEQYTGTGTPDVVTLRHPSTSQSAVFLFSPANNSVQEILTFDEAKRSWFIDETVKSSGKLHLSTPIDPIFLVLPYLKKHCQTSAMPLDQLLRDDDFPETERLIKCNVLKHALNLVADRRGDEDLNAYKYNEEKTLSWLKKKTERVTEILKQKNIHVGAGAVSATFIKCSNPDPNDDGAYLRYAHGIVSEYLVEDLSQKLLKHLNLPEELTTMPAPGAITPSGTPNKRKSSSSSDMKTPKRTKMDSALDEIPKGLDLLNKSDPALTSSGGGMKKLTPASASVKDKSRAKAAAGSKSISSFFKKM